MAKEGPPPKRKPVKVSRSAKKIAAPRSTKSKVSRHAKSARTAVKTPARGTTKPVESLKLLDAAKALLEGRRKDLEVLVQAPSGAARHDQLRRRWMPPLASSQSWTAMQVTSTSTENHCVLASKLLVASLPAAMKTEVRWGIWGWAL